MGFDYRLACLLAAINEDWEDLEAKEDNGTLVVTVRGNVEERSAAEP